MTRTGSTARVVLILTLLVLQVALVLGLTTLVLGSVNRPVPLLTGLVHAVAAVALFNGVAVLVTRVGRDR